MKRIIFVTKKGREFQIGDNEKLIKKYQDQGFIITIKERNEND